jgi:hypothetical protein
MGETPRPQAKGFVKAAELTRQTPNPARVADSGDLTVGFLFFQDVFARIYPGEKKINPA